MSVKVTVTINNSHQCQSSVFCLNVTSSHFSIEGWLSVSTYIVSHVHWLRVLVYQPVHDISANRVLQLDLDDWVLVTCDYSRQLCGVIQFHSHPESWLIMIWKLSMISQLDKVLSASTQIKTSQFYKYIFFVLSPSNFTLEIASFFFPNRAWSSRKLPFATTLWIASIFCWENW